MSANLRRRANHVSKTLEEERERTKPKVEREKRDRKRERGDGEREKLEVYEAIQFLTMSVGTCTCVYVLSSFC
jgi:hypothetical protein